MTEYTPTTEQIELLVLGQLKQSAEKRGLPVDIEADRADFRRWLAAHDAQVRQEAKVQALRDAAKDWRWSDWAEHAEMGLKIANFVGDWISRRADQIEQEGNVG